MPRSSHILTRRSASCRRRTGVLRTVASPRAKLRCLKRRLARPEILRLKKVLEAESGAEHSLRSTVDGSIVGAGSPDVQSGPILAPRTHFGRMRTGHWRARHLNEHAEHAGEPVGLHIDGKLVRVPAASTFTSPGPDSPRSTRLRGTVSTVCASGRASIEALGRAACAARGIRGLRAAGPK